MAVRRRAITARALAKVNLSLAVLGVRPDGYHELRTIFQSIALHDTLTLRVDRGPFRLECDDPACPPEESNLVWLAAERLWTASGRPGRPRNVVVHLVKRIPLQAGLGGGSSDAAAALVALAKLWRLGNARLRDVAASLGADVPYFLEGGTVLGLDRGDLLFPLVDFPTRWVTLAVPDFGVSTKDAYSWWDAGSPRKRGRESSYAMQEKTPGPFFGNDLEALVAERHPDIARLARALRRGGAEAAAMSGSGSAVFGLFADRSDAERAARGLRRRGTCRTFVTRTVNRVGYQRLAGVAGHRISFPFAPRGFGHI